MLSSFKDAPIDDQEGFIWAMRELRTESNYILLSSAGALLGVSAGSQALLSVDPLLLTSRSVALSEFIPGWDAPAMLELLRGPNGAPLSVQLDAPTSFTDVGGAGEANGTTVTAIHARLQVLSTFEGSLQVLHWQRSAVSGASQRLARTASASQLLAAPPQTPRGPANPGVASPPPGAAAAASAKGTPASQPLARSQTSSATAAAAAVAAAVGVEDAPASDGDSVEVGADGEGRDGESSAPLPPPPTIPPPAGIVAASAAPARALASLLAAGEAGPSGGAASSPLPPPPGETPRREDPGGGGGGSVVRFAAAQPRRELGGESASVGSDSQNSAKTSVASTSRAVNRLRRILANASPALLPGLVLLRYAGLALVLLSVGLAVLLTIITEDNFKAIASMVLIIDLGVFKMITKATAILAFQDLLFWGRGWVNLTTGSTDATRAKISALSETFDGLHQRMISLLPANSVWGWTARYITIRNFDVPPSALYTPYTTLNLIEVGSLFTTQLRQVASKLVTPDSVFSEYFDGCAKGSPITASLNTDFVRMGNAHEALAASIIRGFDRTRLNIETVTQLQSYVFLGMMLSAVVVSLFVFLPILLRVDAAGDRILAQFVQIPPLVRRVLYDLAVKRLRLLRRDYADEDDGDEVDVDEEEEGAGGAGAGGSDMGANDPGLQVEEDDLNSATSAEVWARAFAAQQNTTKKVSSYGAAVAARANGCCGLARCCGSGPSGVGGGGSVAYSKSKSAMLLLVVRFLFPVVFLVGLFSTVYGTFVDRIGTVEALTAISTAAGLRAACSRQALTALHKLQYLQVNTEYLNTVYFYTMSGFDCVRSHTRLLAYGTFDPSIETKTYAPYVGRPESGARSALSSAATTAAYTAMHGDACAFLATTYYKDSASFNITRCYEFEGGVMRGGLAAVIEKWWVAGYIASDAQLRGVFTATDAALYEGTGWSLPADTFNYSTVQCRPPRCNPGFVLNPSLTPIRPTYLSDPSYAGDVPVADEPLLPNGTTVYKIANEIRRHENIFLLESDELYLTPALVELFKLYALECDEAIASYLHFLNIFVPLLCVLLGGGLLSPQKPQARSLYPPPTSRRRRAA